MPVFFVHDAAKGIITPLDKKFRLRDVREAEQLSETPAIHSKIQSNVKEYASQSTSDENKHGSDAASLNQSAGRSYQQVQNDILPGRVKDIMSQPALTVSRESSLAEAWLILQKYEIHHLAIVDQNKRLCGMLSEKTLPVYLMSQNVKAPDETPLAVFCDKTVLSTSTETPIDELAQALLEYGLDGVPVTENGNLVGIVTRSDILKTLLRTRAFEVIA